MRGSHRHRGGARRRIAPLLAFAGLALACPSAAVAGTGYLTNDSMLFTVETTTMQVSPVGTLGPEASPISSTAAHTNGNLYAIGGSLGDQSLYVVNRQTGGTSLVGPLQAAPDPTEIFAGLTSTPEGVLYASSYEGGPLNGQLHTVNVTTGLATPVGSPQADDAVLTLAGNCEGVLYGVDESNRLVIVDRASGASPTVAELGLGPMQSAALAFEHGTGILWALVYESGSPEELFQVDPETGAKTPTTFTTFSDLRTLAFDSPAACDQDGDGVTDAADDCVDQPGPASNGGCPVVPDTDPPETTITKQPKDKSSKNKAKYKFTSDEAGSTFECKIDKKPYKPCTSPKKFKAKDGKHKFKVRAIDPAGNVDPKPARDKFKVT